MSHVDPTRMGMLVLSVAFSAAAVWPVKTNVSDRFDHLHRNWAAVLERYVDSGWVNYSALKEQDHALDVYLAELESVSAGQYALWSREQQLAYWINAYNAFTVRLILDHYPIESIRKIGWLPGAPFKKSFIPIRFRTGRNLSLNDIEHNILRTDFKEPRVHFAIVCASKSCPALDRTPYTATDLEDQLDRAARLFINDHSKNRYDTATDTLYLSSIFDWFGSDFLVNSRNLVDFVARYAAPDWGDKLRGPSEPRIRFLSYDWSLNGN